MGKTGYHQLFATCAAGFEYLLVDELRALGGQEVHEAFSGVRFEGDLEVAYRACLWSRLANRVLLPLAEFEANDDKALYREVQRIEWWQHLNADSTLAVTFHSIRSRLSHSRFGAQRVKDAVVDQFMERAGTRPSVSRSRPDLAIDLALRHNRARLSIDLSGTSLHQRGYRLSAGEAPLKENVAAYILMRAGWPALAQDGRCCVDPLCGSGTLLIEAAMIAGDIAPGLSRDYFGFLGWQGHQPETWAKLLKAAKEQAEAGKTRLDGRFFGFDHDSAVLEAASANASRAGLAEEIQFQARSLQWLTNPCKDQPGLLICNAPYGERLGDLETLKPLYRQLGSRLRTEFPDWHASVLTGNQDLARNIGLRATKKYKVRNGPIKCLLLNFQVIEKQYMAGFEQPNFAPTAQLSDGAEMLRNRLQKNLRRLASHLKREDLSCYRIYDADLPEYSAAIDVYGEALHIQEYRAPKEIPEKKARRRLTEIQRVTAEVVATPADRVFVKERRRQRGRAQYRKQADLKDFFEVNEGGLTFQVNLTDYLDTGLFLDHRRVRALVRDMATGQDFLNLFCYTGAATVYAATGGATSTTSVDLSRTYLAWAERNLRLNGIAGAQHQLLRSDAVQWLNRAQDERKRYGLILLDPPTFSNSKSMSDTLDVQRDHLRLVGQCMSLLQPDGALVFSNNYHGFQLDETLGRRYAVEEITGRMIPFDFKRTPRIHRCWLIRP